MEILVIKSLFAPNDEQFQNTFNTMDSLLNLNNDRHNITYCFCGWINDNKNTLILKKKAIPGSLFLIKGTNFGKMWYIKRVIDLIKNTGKNYDIVFYCDHDIIINFQLDIFELFSKIKMKMKNIGFIALNQEEDCRHQVTCFANEINVQDNYLCYPEEEDYGSIATGCYITTYNNFEKIKDIKFNTVYGFDDYYINVYFISENLVNYVFRDINVIHPYDEDVNYKRWKLEMVNNIIDYGINKINTKFYYNTIQMSINYWNGFCNKIDNK